MADEPSAPPQPASPRAEHAAPEDLHVLHTARCVHDDVHARRSMARDAEGVARRTHGTSCLAVERSVGARRRPCSSNASRKATRTPSPAACAAGLGPWCRRAHLACEIASQSKDGTVDGMLEPSCHRLFPSCSSQPPSREHARHTPRNALQLEPNPQNSSEAIEPRGNETQGGVTDETEGGASDGTQGGAKRLPQTLLTQKTLLPPHNAHVRS